jgi:hypothetical protein
MDIENYKTTLHSLSEPSLNLHEKEVNDEGKLVQASAGVRLWRTMMHGVGLYSNEDARKYLTQKTITKLQSQAALLNPEDNNVIQKACEKPVNYTELISTLEKVQQQAKVQFPTSRAEAPPPPQVMISFPVPSNDASQPPQMVNLPLTLTVEERLEMLKSFKEDTHKSENLKQINTVIVDVMTNWKLFMERSPLPEFSATDTDSEVNRKLQLNAEAEDGVIVLYHELLDTMEMKGKAIHQSLQDRRTQIGGTVETAAEDRVIVEELLEQYAFLDSPEWSPANPLAQELQQHFPNIHTWVEGLKEERKELLSMYQVILKFILEKLDALYVQLENQDLEELQEVLENANKYKKRLKPEEQKDLAEKIHVAQEQAHVLRAQQEEKIHAVKEDKKRAEEAEKKLQEVGQSETLRAQNLMQRWRSETREIKSLIESQRQEAAFLRIHALLKEVDDPKNIGLAQRLKDEWRPLSAEIDALRKYLK